MKRSLPIRRGEKVFMVRRYQAGRVVEQSGFWVSPNVKPRNSRKRGCTPQRKQDANGRAAVRRLARTINGNFGPGDYLLTAKYDAKGMEKINRNAEEAKHQLKLFTERLRNAVKKTGAELKWIGITSEVDGDTGEVVRIHHHMVVSGDAFQVEHKVMYVGSRKLDGIWKFGTVDWQPLKHQDDYTPLALYLCRQAHCGRDEKKWSCSRNLEKPNIRERIIIPRELRVPAGATVLEKGSYDPLVGTHYIRYLLPKREEKKNGRRKRRVKPEI